jgi:cyclic beta-1,2-glucan synthetase
MIPATVTGALPGTKQSAGILVAYFTSEKDARQALWELEKRGFSRAALLHKSSDRAVRVRDTFFDLRFFRVGLIALLFAALAVAATSFLPQAGIPLPAPLSLPIAAAGAALAGILLGWITYPRSRFGIERRVLREQSQWLLSGESALLLQAPLHALREPQLIIRESSETQPTIFFLLPARGAGVGAAPETILLPQNQLQRFAERLADLHREPARPVRDARLLRQAAEAADAIRTIWLDLSDAHLLEQPVTAAAEWLLDNEYVVENNARDVRANLPGKYFRELPVLEREPFRNLPRVYGLAKEFISRVDLRLTRENLLAFLAAYQSAQPLAVGELWALPQMLRITLIEGIRALAEQTIAELREREKAGFWANRLIAAGRQDPGRVFTMLAKLIQESPAPGDYFSSQLVDYLYDEANALTLVQNWLERTLAQPLAGLALREQNRQIRAQIAIGNAFTSLRVLSLLDWRKIFEEVNRTEALLRRDPAGIYPQMDFETRNRYREMIEEIARDAGLAEETVAERVVELAAGRGEADPPGDDRLRHVGYYLVGGGRREFMRGLGCRRSLHCLADEWLIGSHPGVYLAGLSAVFAALLAPPVWLCWPAPPVLRVMLILLFALPVSQAAVEIVNYLVTRWMPPRTLPKLDFEKTGVPERFRTLVVVPTLLTDAESIRSDVERLEIRCLGNKDPNLLFALLSDFDDADSPQCPEDAALLQQAVESIRALNARSEGSPYFLFHREREWSESEQAYIGRERKRGKLEELHQYLEGARPEPAAPFLRVGEPARLAGIRFILTLDSDTQLPPAAARRMIGALAHPLNQPRPDPRGGIASPSFTILQPRVSPSLPSALATPFSRLFADPIGVDPYTRAVSDVYQDLAGEGSFNGKGLYDWRAFSRVLTGRFPKEHLLSHDLIEGEHVRTGLASDIELFDEFPRTYLGYTRRQHRWIRGDWQIIDWLLPVVPLGSGKWVRNRLSLFSRWKIFDNLRRSLVPVAVVALLLVAGFFFAPAAGAASALAAFMLLFMPLSVMVTGLTGGGLAKIQPSRLGHDLLRGIAEAALLPRQAGLAADAILKVWYRRVITHRGFLRWTSAQAIRRRTADHTGAFLLSFLPYAALSAIALAALFRLGAGGALPLAPWLALWIASPGLAVLFNLRRRPRPVRSYLRPADRDYLRGVARRTWQFFADCISETTAWLPPDNYQVSHQNRLALRTSPTNIGMSLLSTLAARDFGYLTGDQVIGNLSRSFESIAKLDRFNGHLLNWYDLQTLKPLEPRYVSTVDSGNLLAALYAIETGLSEMLRRPVLDTFAFEGLADTLAILRKAYAAGPRPRRFGSELLRLGEQLSRPPENALDAVRLLRRIKAEADSLSEKIVTESGPASAAAVWLGRLQEQVNAWITVADRYLRWMELAGEAAGSLPPADQPAIRQALGRAACLADLAAGDVPVLAILESFRSAAGRDPEFTARLDRTAAEFSVAKWLAGEMLGTGDRLLQSVRTLCREIDLRFLYDSDRRLFSIGYNVSEGRLDPSYYDLLASESRLGSFLAVARGEAPVEHWFSLGRPYRGIGRRQVLVSWTGTMFEYLMPLLFQRTFGNSLLDKAVRDAVAVQIRYGRRRGVPWGLSESAFGDLDINRSYQYKAFGVPALGLKRMSEEELVVAPYATLLALELAPREATGNLRRLEGIGLLGDYGFFDAVDFSRNAPGRRKGTLIRTYMAHHQSMAFLALSNLLQGASVRRYFRSNPVLQASELLLQERIPYPPPAFVPVARDRGLPPLPVGEAAVEEGRFETPHTLRPHTHLLGHEDFSVMITNSGGGYSRWRRLDLTRWRADRTRDGWGTFCYLRDPDTGKVWSGAYHPVGGDVPEEYAAQFLLDRAVIRRRDNAVDLATEIFVSAEDDVEIRRMTLINRSLLPRTIELTSYIELVLAAHAADLQHPGFQKIFVQTEAVPAARALLAWRRKRAPEEPGCFVAHRWTLPHPPEDPFQFETDRARFIGRGRSLADPLGLMLAPGNTRGSVLDPIFSIRECVPLEPGQRIQASMVIAAGETREAALALAAKYGDPHAIERAVDFSSAAAQIELRSLRIYPDDARQFQKLASHLIYPSPLLRTSAEEIERNHRGQSALWPYGISGDLPILTATVGDTRDLGLIRQVLQAHTYLRKHGLWADLVILNEEFGGYERPLKEELEEIIRGFAVYTGTDQPGGIFLRNADQIPKEDLLLLRTASSAVLVASRGALSQQLGVRMEVPELPEPMARRRPVRDASALLPFMELPYFNSLGGFTSDGREYAVYLGPGTNSPAPWINVLANPSFGSVVSESGSGSTWSGNSQRNRLTAWSNDAVLDPPAETIYLRDEDTGAFWTPTPAPVREETAYRARHGAGYTIFEHNSNGIQQELIVLVPLDDGGGDPVKLQRLRLKNDTSRRRRLAVNYFVEWTLGENREATQMHIVTRWDAASRALTAENRYHPDSGERIAFASLTPAPESYSGDRLSFMGRNRNPGNPAALERVRRSQRVGAKLDPSAALQLVVELNPGETRDVVCLLGEAGTIEQVRELVEKYRADAAFEAAFAETRRRWDDLLGAIQVRTPELSVDLLLNRWLPYQTLACRLWARSAFYQSGGAYGFRDQLQDSLAFLYTHPELTREQILRAAGRQFVEGDVQHWWHPPTGAGVRTRIADDSLWLAYATAEYVRVTGDAAVLNEQIPFLAAAPLEDGQLESYGRPETTPERAALFEHCRRGVDRLLRFGPHGLPLMGTGDWDDGLNRVGIGGKGESVWLGWFLAEALRGMAELCGPAARPELAPAYRHERTALLKELESSAWDGEWYRRGFFDDGTPLGTKAAAEARIFSLPQSWARLCGDADPERCARALESAWTHLVREEPGLTLLFEPPFESFQPFPGYIQAYPPGVRENGGQYSHAAVWLAMAFARQGDGDRARKILRMINPAERARDPETVWRYEREPYAVAADIYNAEDQVGRGGWSWYTGSAGWMYRAWIEELLGMKIRDGWLRIDPTLPHEWERVDIRYRCGEAVYEIRIDNPEHVMHGVAALEMDGRPVPQLEIRLERALVLHRVVVRMGKS